MDLRKIWSVGAWYNEMQFSFEKSSGQRIMMYYKHAIKSLESNEETDSWVPLTLVVLKCQIYYTDIIFSISENQHENKNNLALWDRDARKERKW